MAQPLLLHEAFQKERSRFWPYLRATPSLSELAHDIWHWDEDIVRLAEQLVDSGIGRSIRQELDGFRCLRTLLHPFSSRRTKAEAERSCAGIDIHISARSNTVAVDL